MSDLSALLIEGYLGGINAPAIEQAGYSIRINAQGTNLEYVPLQQTVTGSGTWDGKSETVAVFGSGARVITIPDADRVGREVIIIDAAGNASTSNIAMTPVSGSTINGFTSINFNSDYSKGTLRYVATHTWVRIG
jgi:hypothetical protein